MNLLISILSFLGFQACGPRTCQIAYNSLETTGQEVDIGSTANGGNAIAQSFYVASATTLKSIALKLQKSGTVATGHTLSVTIVNDNSDNPTGSTLSTTMTLQTDSITTTSAYYTLTPTEFSISSGTYWILIVSSYPVSASGFIKAAAHDGTTGDYTYGKVKYRLSDGTTWSTLNIGTLRDIVFEVGC